MNELIKQSITCTEYANNNGKKDNKAMATIGDKLLSFLFMDYLYGLEIFKEMEDYSNLNEIIQYNETQEFLGKKIFIDNLKPLAINNDLKGDKGYATCLEAYIYALYKVEGLIYVRDFLREKIIPLLNEKEVIEIIKNHLVKSKEPSSKEKFSEAFKIFYKYTFNKEPDLEK